MSQNEHQNSIVSAHSLTVAYHDKPVLWNIELDVVKPELIAVVGPNGAGKSTFIKALLGIIPVLSGKAMFWGQSFDQVRDQIAYVPQRESVDWEFPITAGEVVAMGRYIRRGLFGRLPKVEYERAHHYLSRVSMAEFAARPINQLSGGQQQRVFIARALAREAKIYFMDEPFSGVDVASEREILGVMQELKANGTTVVVVNHDLISVRQNFDSVILLNTRLIGFGPIATTLTEDRLMQTYSGRLQPLEDISAIGTAKLKGQSHGI